MLIFSSYFVAFSWLFQNSTLYTGINGWVPKQRLSSFTEMLPINETPTTNSKRTRPVDKTFPVLHKKTRIDNPKMDMTEEEYNSYLQKNLQHNTNFPVELPVRQTKGKSMLGLMDPQLPYACDHEAIPLLKG